MVEVGRLPRHPPLCQLPRASWHGPGGKLALVMGKGGWRRAERGDVPWAGGRPPPWEISWKSEGVARRIQAPKPPGSDSPLFINDLRHRPGGAASSRHVRLPVDCGGCVIRPHHTRTLTC